MSQGQRVRRGLQSLLVYTVAGLCLTACGFSDIEDSARSAAFLHGEQLADGSGEEECPATERSDAELAKVPKVACARAKSDKLRIRGNYWPGSTAVGKDGSRYVVGTFTRGRLELGKKIRWSSGWDHDKTGGSGFVIKYGKSGKVAWAHKLDSESFVNLPSVSVDDRGNVFLSGYTEGPLRVGKHVVSNPEQDDLFVAKLDRKGQLKWARFGGDEENTLLLGHATDPRGNMYITGQFAGELRFGKGRLRQSGPGDLFLIKHTPNGELAWARQVGGEGRVIPRDIAIDAAGNVLITGSVEGKSQFDDIELDNGGGTFLAKFQPSGAVQWVRGAVGSGRNEGKEVAVSPRGDIYIAGQHFHGLSFGDVTLPGDQRTRAYLAKYDETGTPEWARNISEPGKFNMFSDLEATGAGDVYVLAAFGFSGFTSEGKVIPITGAPKELENLAVDSKDQPHLTFGPRDIGEPGFEVAWSQCRVK